MLSSYMAYTALSDDLAARRALISSGLVGLSTAVMTKYFKVNLDISLPVSVAGAITLDFIVNRHQNTHGLDIAKNECGAYLNELVQDAKGTVSGIAQDLSVDVWRHHNHGVLRVYVYCRKVPTTRG